MIHTRHITLNPGDTYRFRVAVPDVEGAALLLDTPALAVARGESVEICVACLAPAIERKAP